MEFTIKKIIVIFLISILILVFTFLPKNQLNCTTTSDCLIKRAIAAPVFIIGGTFVAINFLIDQIFPATNVQIELDNGTLKPAKLYYKAIGSRNVNNGDKVRLNCSQNTKFKNGKLCQLQFYGFDKYNGCPKDSPCYGKIPEMTIEVDEFDLPDETMLKYSK